MKSSVQTVAPLRVSFVGGGTDLPSFYLQHEGAVVSCSINKYVYVHVKRHDPAFQERFRITYSEVENTHEQKSIKNDIVRATLELLNFDEPVQILTASDLPAGSGLGSSSSFAVALLLAIHSIKGSVPSKWQLAEEACEVELNILAKSIGKQDQYAAAFGGLNFIKFLPGNKVRIQPIQIRANKSRDLMSKSRLFWTGATRQADEILVVQKENIGSNIENLKSLTNIAKEFRSILEEPNVNWVKLSELISAGWILKKRLSPTISNSSIEDLLGRVSATFGQGVKLLGAGAGGFVYSLDTEDSSRRGKIDFPEPFFSPQIDEIGARVISEI
jgi:D-glycero-alpha-D-manno-heptose-7-phosphate kinase